jgi:hypothetical protein
MNILKRAEELLHAQPCAHRFVLREGVTRARHTANWRALRRAYGKQEMQSVVNYGIKGLAGIICPRTVRGWPWATLAQNMYGGCVLSPPWPEYDTSGPLGAT